MLAPSNADAAGSPAGVPAASVSPAGPACRGGRADTYFGAFVITRISFARFAPAASLKYTTT
jgi:hypothetical protein